MLNRNDESALSGIDDRINSMERRLRNAKAARDSYVDYLRSKYPTWNPSLSSFKLEHNAHEPLVNRLATSEYQWDLDSDHQKPRRPALLFSQNNDELSRSMPTSGPLLESDIRNTKRRLLEISAQLKTLRGSRMSMSTDQFMRFAPFMATQREKISLATSENERLDRLDTVRQRLSDLALTGSHSPIRTPTEEQKTDIRMEEEKDQLMADIRSGLVSTNWDSSYHMYSDPRPQSPPYDNPIQPVQALPATQKIPVKEENKVNFADPIVEPRKKEEPVPTPSYQPPQPTQPTKQDPPKPAENSYSLLKLLNQNNDDSSDDSDLPTTSAAKQTSKPQSTPNNNPPPPKPIAGMGLLSQYLNKDDSDSEDDPVVTTSYKPPAPAVVSKPSQSMSKSFMDAGDSDDDFFD